MGNWKERVNRHGLQRISVVRRRQMRSGRRAMGRWCFKMTGRTEKSRNKTSELIFV
jgi:hypothetical protein